MLKLKKIFILIIVLLLSYKPSFAMDIPKKLNISGEVVAVSETLKYNFVQSISNSKSKLRLNDIILKLTDKETDLIYPKKILDNIYILGDREVVATIIRDNEKIDINVSVEDFKGIELSRIFSYVATITALDKYNKFIGLSHEALIGKTTLVDDLIEESKVYKVDYIEVDKKRFFGMSSFQPRIYGFEVIGTVESYIKHGIKGYLHNSDCNFKWVETANPKEGVAYIYCKSPLTNKFRLFPIRILKVEDEISCIKILDKELLKYNGGLIKGMSGSPVLQDGKLVGGIRSSINKRENLGRITNIRALFTE